MPFVFKSHPRELRPTRAPSVNFTEWAYEGARPSPEDNVAWFTAETSGGFGLYALGRVVSEAEDSGKNAKGNNLITVAAEFYAFGPSEPLLKADFAALPRLGLGSPLQELNRRLYLNSHVKIAEIDDETFQYLARRFY